MAGEAEQRVNQNLSGRAIQGVMPIVRNSGLLVSLATFQVPDGLTDGGFVSPNYVDVAGLVDIACTAPPLSTGTGLSASEAKGVEKRDADQQFHVLLDSYYPAVDDVWRGGGRVVIDGTAYNLTGHERDSQKQMSRVRAENVTA